jgi:hypothetical protein
MRSAGCGPACCPTAASTPSVSLQSEHAPHHLQGVDDLSDIHERSLSSRRQETGALENLPSQATLLLIEASRVVMRVKHAGERHEHEKGMQ